MWRIYSVKEKYKIVRFIEMFKSYLQKKEGII